MLDVPAATPEAPSRTRRVVLLLALAAVFATAAAFAVLGDRPLPPDDPARGLVYAGMSSDVVHCGTHRWRVDVAGSDLVGCGHLDTAPKGVDVRVKVPTSVLQARVGAGPQAVRAAQQAGVAGSVADAGDPAVPCDGDGASGYRVQAMYVVEAGVANRYADLKPSLQRWAAGVDDVFNRSAALTGGVRHLRYVTEPSGGTCVAKVLNVTVPAGSNVDFNHTIAAVQAQGTTTRRASTSCGPTRTGCAASAWSTSPTPRRRATRTTAPRRSGPASTTAAGATATAARSTRSRRTSSRTPWARSWAVHRTPPAPATATTSPTPCATPTAAARRCSRSARRTSSTCWTATTTTTTRRTPTPGRGSTPTGTSPGSRFLLGGGDGAGGGTAGTPTKARGDRAGQQPGGAGSGDPGAGDAGAAPGPHAHLGDVEGREHGVPARLAVRGADRRDLPGVAHQGHHADGHAGRQHRRHQGREQPARPDDHRRAAPGDRRGAPGRAVGHGRGRLHRRPRTPAGTGHRHGDRAAGARAQGDLPAHDGRRRGVDQARPRPG
nr:hypothetical protein [Angustibacter aerolatus]